MRELHKAIAALAAIGLAAAAGAAEPGPIFRERAADLGVGFRHFNGMSGELYFVEMVGPGGALFDYDGDGDLDLYLVQGHMLGGKPLAAALAAEPPQLPLRDRLYRNDLTVREDGTRELKLVDVTAEAGLDATGYGMGAATGDFDNDGWIDLYVTNFGPNQLWRNNGPGADGEVTFSDVTEETRSGDASWSIGAAFFDYDGDGWLDLFVANYVDFSLTDNKFCPAPSGGRDYCGPLAYAPLADRLLHSGGGKDGRLFTDVTARAGLTRRANGMGVVTGDFDGNGWEDLYVANDAMANQLWLNQGPGKDGGVVFVDDAPLAGCAFNLDGRPEASMGIAAGDVDGDGREDFLVTHLVHETNTVYLSRDSSFFLDSSEKTGLGAPSWLSTGFGVAFVDYDNDGWLDVLVANGAVRLFDRDAPETRASVAEGGAKEGGRITLADWTLAQPNLLFHNRGDGRFEDVTAQAGEVFRLVEVSRGVAVGDLDNDGDVDAVIQNNHGPVRILINQVGQDHAWLGVRAVAAAGGRLRDVLGAEVTIERGGRLLRRRVRTAGSYASASDPRIVFGLGADASPATVRVRWPGGEVEEWPEVPAGRYATLVRGEGRPVDK